jgi:hypothetical protein
MEDDKAPEKIRIGFPEVDGTDIAHPPLRAFCDYCLSVKPADDYADRSDFDVFRLKPWLGYMMIVAYQPEIRDFRYRLYGTYLADQAGFDLTGSLVSQMPRGIGDFILRLYLDCVDTRKLVYSEHTHVHARYSCDWHRVLCPVRDRDNIQVVGCNIPVATPIR